MKAVVRVVALVIASFLGVVCPAQGPSTPPYGQVFQPITLYLAGTPAINGVACSPANNAQVIVDTTTSLGWTCDGSTGVFQWNVRYTASGYASYWVSGTNDSSIGFGANATQMWDFVPTVSVSSTKITYSIGVADNSGNLYDIGIYNSAGTLICHIGATAGTTFAPSTGNKTLNFLAPCILIAGKTYYYAQTGNAAVAQISKATNVFTGLNGAAPTSGSTTSGGVLNSSVTVASPTWPNTVNGMIAFVLRN